MSNQGQGGQTQDPPVKDPVKEPVKEVVKDPIKDKVKPSKTTALKNIDPELLKRMEERYPVGSFVSDNCWVCNTPTFYNVKVAGIICDCLGV